MRLFGLAGSLFIWATKSRAPRPRQQAKSDSRTVGLRCALSFLPPCLPQLAGHSLSALRREDRKSVGNLRAPALAPRATAAWVFAASLDWCHPHTISVYKNMQSLASRRETALFCRLDRWKWDRLPQLVPVSNENVVSDYPDHHFRALSLQRISEKIPNRLRRTGSDGYIGYRHID